ncbi:hypothetical protein BpHYR1_045074 [Brachionus plicatilis]|uniref:Uncharacterized protein n=1 Tax=Brachionus plicatilis TaxID=10195 RepID=A0A3M7SL69_BRAPC|nr:hypothetical protein BpHYR1_045074 [Brachionus plicatilis]
MIFYQFKISHFLTKREIRDKLQIQSQKSITLIEHKNSTFNFSHSLSRGTTVTFSAIISNSSLELFFVPEIVLLFFGFSFTSI